LPPGWKRGFLCAPRSSSMAHEACSSFRRAGKPGSTASRDARRHFGVPRPGLETRLDVVAAGILACCRGRASLPPGWKRGFLCAPRSSCMAHEACSSFRRAGKPGSTASRDARRHFEVPRSGFDTRLDRRELLAMRADAGGILCRRHQRCEGDNDSLHRSPNEAGFKLIWGRSNRSNGLAPVSGASLQSNMKKGNEYSADKIPKCDPENTDGGGGIQGSTITSAAPLHVTDAKSYQGRNSPRMFRKLAGALPTMKSSAVVQ
jgi:hypothetical protein